MTPDPRNRISELYHAALERAPERRLAFLNEACDGDNALREEVESLLRYESSQFLERPVAGIAAGVVTVPPGGTGMLNRQIGPYTIVAQLGSGGMGEVYRARDSKLGRDVAIKVLPAHFTADAERRSRFAREARLLATLSQPHIGAIYGLEETEGVTALVLELVEGPTLADRLTRGPLPIADALLIARQVAEALDAAHEKGIVHRDLKPANIVLQRLSSSADEVCAKVLDFGLAKTMGVGLDGDLTQCATDSVTGTAEGRILGTPAYMSPEQARGLTVDKRTDIWAFGCILYEMLTRHRAFEGATITDTLAQVLEHEPDWSALPVATPEAVRGLLRRCLEKNPARRVRDIRDLRLDLENALAKDASERDERAGESRAALERIQPDDTGASPLGLSHERKTIATAMNSNRHGERERRKLAVIMFTDVVGFSAMAQDNEARSLELLAEHATILRPLFTAFDGVEIKTIGDAFLVEFASAVVATQCAIEIQNTFHVRNKNCGFSRRLELRIGLHLGDIVRTDNDVLGDGVNIASRIQALADPNGVCISQQVFDHVRGKLDITFLELRGPALKSLDTPIRVYSIRFAWTGKPRSWAEQLANGVRFRIGNLRIVITMMVAAFVIVTTGPLLELLRRPAALRLTINKPEGGTIVGPGIECGTRGSRCSTITTGEPIELEAHPDKDYVFSGYTGDCAPSGQMVLTEPRTCGANFGRIEGSAPPVTFRLTIIKPEGGTVVGAGGILCGVNGSTCSADIPSGLPVTLRADAADGSTFQQFTGDCPSTGEMAMTSTRTCGATFVASTARMNPSRVPTTPVLSRPDPRAAPVAPRPAAPTNAPPPAPVPTNPPGFQGPTPTTTQGQTAPDKPVERPITAEEHARREIGQLVTNYCAALNTLNPANIRKLFHVDNERELRNSFREYKSLKCSVTAPPEFDRLDASPAGDAQLRFGMKHVLEMRSGGAPRTLDVKVTMVVSRKDFQSQWLIDRTSTDPRF